VKHHFRLALLMGLLHSLFFLLSFPPVGLWGAVFLTLPPLYVVALTTDRPWRSGLGVFLGALPAWALEHLWIVHVTGPGFPGLVAMMSLYPALFVVLSAKAMQTRLADSVAGRWLTMPVLWTGLEYLRGQISFDGYPWYLLGQALVLGPDALEPTVLSTAAQYVGGYGLTLLIAATSCIAAGPVLYDRDGAPAYRLTLVVLRGAICVIAWSLSVAGITAILEANRSDTNAPGALRIGIVQTNVPQDNKIGWTFAQQVEDFGRFLEMTRDVADLHTRPDLIVWPETMFPGITLDPEATRVERDAQLVFADMGAASTVFVDSLLSLQTDLRIPMLVGAIGYDNLTAIDPTSDNFIQAEAKYNSVFLIENGRVQEDRYDKIHLTPFGEVMPYISQVDWLEKSLLAIGAGGMTFDLDAGSRPIRFNIDGARIVTPICFEATMSGVMRRLVGRGPERANIVVQVSNDGWFADAKGPREMHALLARLRAIELGVPVVRVVNTGVSCVFTPTGRRKALLARIGDGSPASAPYLPAESGGVAIVDVILDGRPTLYSRLGDILGWVCLACTLVFGAWAALTGARTARARQTPLQEESPGQEKE
jgi:apolipoprotein N-acyltransferase